MSLKINKDFIVTIVFVIFLGICLKSFPFILQYIGNFNYQNGNYTFAYKMLQKAYFMRPQDKKFRYDYTLALSKLYPSMQIQQELCLIAESEQDDSARNLAQQTIAKLRAKIVSNYPNNYIEEASTSEGILRWDIKSFPLKIYLDDLNVSVPEYYNIEIFKALNLWEQSIDFVKFKKIDNEKNADIIIKLSPLPKDTCNQNVCKFVVGLTEPQIEKNILEKMVITLYDKDPFGRYFSDKKMFNTIAHELGHALGIMGHSYNSNDIMYMSTAEENNFSALRSSFQYITQADKNTLKLLYTILPNISNIPISKIESKDLIYAPIVLGNSEILSDKKIKEGKYYIKNAPHLPSGYLTLASAYAQNGDFERAVKILKKGLTKVKRDEDKFQIYYNLTVIYINDNKFKNAQKALNEAQKIKTNQDTEKLQQIIFQHNS